MTTLAPIARPTDLMVYLPPAPPRGTGDPADRRDLDDVYGAAVGLVAGANVGFLWGRGLGMTGAVVGALFGAGFSASLGGKSGLKRSLCVGGAALAGACGGAALFGTAGAIGGTLAGLGAGNWLAGRLSDEHLGPHIRFKAAALAAVGAVIGNLAGAALYGPLGAAAGVVVGGAAGYLLGDRT